MRKDRFTDEALRNAQALAELEFSESYDFARCQRADGSFYPIPEGKQCRKGTKASPIDPGAKRLGGRKPVTEGGKKLKTDFRKEVAEGAARRKKGEANIVSKQKEEARLRKAIARMYSRETNARRDGDTAAAKKFMKAHSELVKRLEEVTGTKGYDAAPKRSARSKPRSKKIEELRNKVSEAKKSGDKKRLASLRGDLQGQERMRKIEGQARKSGKSVDDTIRARQASADKKVKKRLFEEQMKRLENRLDDAVTVKEQRRIGDAISDLRKRMGEL